MRYLDFAATSPVLEEVVEAMLPYLKDHFGNPSSVYGAGRDAKKGLEEAREQVAAAIGSQPSEIVFTAGGTEADNLALKGVVSKMGGKRHIVTSAIEHHAVLHAAQWLEKQGHELTIVPCMPNGVVDVDALRDSVRKDTAVVSLMMANNEIGTIQPVKEVVQMVRERSKALVHTDAVQALGKVPVDVADLGVDLAAFAAHKVGGPKGTGALFVKRRTPIEPILHGGGQERDVRSGTPNVAGIAGFGVAAAIAAKEVDEEAFRLSALRDRLQERICADVAGVTVNGLGAPRVGGVLNVCIEGVEGESLLLLLDQNGIAASSGSACTSGSLDPSHVLTAMGVPRQLALGSLRISFGRSSTPEDVDAVLQVLPGVVEKLRKLQNR